MREVANVEADVLHVDICERGEKLSFRNLHMKKGRRHYHLMPHQPVISYLNQERLKRNMTGRSHWTCSN